MCKEHNIELQIIIKEILELKDIPLLGELNNM